MSRDIIDAFEKALNEGNIEEVKTLLEKHRDWATRIEILNIPAQKGDMAMLEFLLPEVSNQKYIDNGLREAATFGRLGAFEFLLGRVHSQRAFAFAITNAAAKGHLKIVEILSTKVNPNALSSAMDLANKNGHTEVREFLGNKINSMPQSVEVGISGASGDSQPVKAPESKILEASPPVNNNQYKVQTQIPFAPAGSRDLELIKAINDLVSYAEAGNIEEVKRLHNIIENHPARQEKVDPKKKYAGGSPYNYGIRDYYLIALEKAAINKRPEVVKFLLEINKGKNTSNRAAAEYQSVLSYHFTSLVRNGNVAISTIISPYIQNVGVLVNVYSEMGDTSRISSLLPRMGSSEVDKAMIIAVKNDREKVVRILLPQLQDKAKLHESFLLSIGNQNLPIIQQLLPKIQDPKILADGLKISAAHDNKGIIEALIHKVKDKEALGEAIAVSAERGSTRALSYLLDEVKDQQTLNSAFLSAVKSGKLEAVRALRNTVGDQRTFESALALASSDNAAMKTFLSQSIKDIGKIESKFNKAVNKGDIDLIKKILPKIKDQDVIDNAFINALESGDKKVVAELYSKQSSLDVNTLASNYDMIPTIAMQSFKSIPQTAEEYFNSFEKKYFRLDHKTDPYASILAAPSDIYSMMDNVRSLDFTSPYTANSFLGSGETNLRGGVKSEINTQDVLATAALTASMLYIVRAATKGYTTPVEEERKESNAKKSTKQKKTIETKSSENVSVSEAISTAAWSDGAQSPDNNIWNDGNNKFYDSSNIVKEVSTEENMWGSSNNIETIIEQSVRSASSEQQDFSVGYIAKPEDSIKYPEVIEDNNKVENNEEVEQPSAENEFVTSYRTDPNGAVLLSIKLGNEELTAALSKEGLGKVDDRALYEILDIATRNDDQDLIKNIASFIKNKNNSMTSDIIDIAINGNGLGLQGLIESGVIEINEDLLNKAVLDGNSVKLNKILELNSKREAPVDLKLKMEGENNILYLVYKKRLSIASANQALNDKYLNSNQEDREKIAEQMASNLDRTNKMYDSVNVLLEKGLIDLNAASRFNVPEIDQKHFLIQTYKELSTYREALNDGVEGKFKELHQSNVARLEKTLSNLLANGVNKRVVDEYGQNIAMLAAQNGDIEILKLYTEKGNNQLSDLLKDRDRMGNTALLHAAEFEATYVFDFLIQQGAEFRDKNRALIKNNKGTTPLMLLAKNGHINTSDRFVISEKDVIDVDNMGNTPMHYLAMGSGGISAPYILEGFIVKGANINARNVDGATPLMQAVINGNSGLVKDLISKGADVNIPDKYGNTPLVCACLLNNKDVINAVLSSPLVDVKKANNRGISPYLIASQRDALQKLTVDNPSDDTKEFLKKWEPNSYEGLSKALILKGASPSEIESQSLYNTLMATTHEITAAKFLSEANNIIISPDPKLRGLSSEMVTQVANLSGAKITYTKASEEFEDEVVSGLKDQIILDKEALKDEIMVGSFRNEGIGSVKYGEALGDGFITTPEALANAAYGKDRDWLLKASEALSAQYVGLQKSIESQPWYYRIFMPWKGRGLNKAAENVLQAHGVIALAIKSKANETEDLFEAKYTEKGGLIDLVSQSPKKLMDKILYSHFDTEDPEISRANELINSVVQKEIASSPKTFYMFAKFAAERDKLLNSSDAKKASFLKSYNPQKDQLVLNLDGNKDVSVIKSNTTEVSKDLPSYEGKSSVISSLNWLSSDNNPYKAADVKEMSSVLSDTQYKDVGIFSGQLGEEAFSTLQKGVISKDKDNVIDIRGLFNKLKNILPRIKKDDQHVKEPIEPKQNVDNSHVSYLSTSNPPINEINTDVSINASKVVEEINKKDVGEAKKEESKNKDGKNI